MAHLHILSGPRLAVLLVGVAHEDVVYGGCHGLESAGRDLHSRHPRAHRSCLTATRRALAAALPSIPGARLEWKGLAVSLHYRRVSPRRRLGARKGAERILRRGGLTPVPGHAGFDFLPRGGGNQG